MKFHNQKSFRGHEISNVENKPLLHKKGKQWIVVAVSALVLAGFGGMVSTTTHADTNNAKPAVATKVDQPNDQNTKPNNSGSDSNVMKQAQGMHKALANNAVVQKPSVSSSAVANKTTPASATSTTSAKSSSVSASSGVSSKASSSAKSSVSSNSNGSNNGNATTKPVVHMLGMGNPMLTDNSSTDNDMTIPLFGTVVASGNMPQSTGNTAKWSLDQNGVFLIHDGIFSAKNSGTWGNADIPNNEVNNIQYIEFHNVDIPNDFSINNMPNLKIIDFSGINPSTPDTESPHYWQGALMNNPKLVTINFGQNLHTQNISGDTGSFMSGDSSLKNLRYFNKLDLSGLTDTNDFFTGDSSLTNLDLSNFNSTKASNNNNAAWGGTNGLTDFITGCTALRTIELGSNTILTSKAINGDINGSFAFGPTGLKNIADGQSHPGTWVLLQGPNSTTADGVQWTQDQNHDLIIHDGTMNNDTWPTNINKSDIKHIYTSNVTAPSSLQSMFSSLSNLQSIDLSGMKITTATTKMGSLFQNDRNLQSITFASDDSNNNTSNVSDMSWMFAGDYSLKDLRLPKWFNTAKANISFMFDSDNNNVENIPGSTYPGLQSLTLPDSFQNNQNSSNVFGAGQTSQTYNLYKLTLGSGTRLGNANLPSNQWTQGSKTLNSSDLENNSDYAGTWNGPVTETIIYQYNDKNVPFQNNYEPNPGYYKPRGTYNTSNSGMDWDAYSTNHMPTDWNVVSNDPSLHFKYSDGIHYVNIKPNSATDTINYQLINGTTVNSHQFTGSIDDHSIVYPSGMSGDTSFNADSSSDISSGYHAISNNDSFGYDGKSHPVKVAPNTLNDTIHYVVSDNTDYAKSGFSVANQAISFNDSRAISAGDNNGVVTSANNTHVPSGYHMESSNVTFTGTTNASNTNISDKVSIVPDEETLHVSYMNGKSLISSSAYTGFMDNSATISAPANYKLNPGQSSNFTYGAYNRSNSTSSVQVTPNNVNETIDYEYQGHNEGTSSVSGLYNSSSEITSTNAKGINSGWHLASNSNFTFNNGSVNVNVAPNSINDKIEYKVANNTSYAKANSVLNSSEVVRLNDSRASVTGNTSAVINSVNNKYVPTGYHMASDNVTVGKKTTNAISASASDVIAIVPNNETESVNYAYSNNTSHPVSSSTISGYYDNAGSVASNTVPNGWQFSTNPDNSFTFGYNNNTDDVNIVPRSASATVEYQVSDTGAKNNGSSIANYKSTGNSAAASSAGNNNFIDTSVDNIPAGYHIINGQNTKIPYDNDTHIIKIAPNTINDSIKYRVSGTNKDVSNSSLALNDGRAKGTGNNSVVVNNMPTNYHLAPNASNVFSHTTNSANSSALDIVYVKPNTVTVNYMNSENNSIVSSKTASYNSQNSTHDDFAIPSDYQLVQSNGALRFTSLHSTSNVAVTPVQKTDVINYMNGDAKVASDVYTGDDMYASGASHTSYNANDYVPADYHVVNDGGNTFYFDGQTHTVTVYPNEIIIEFNNGKLGSKKVDTSTDTAYQIKGSDMPSNYHLANRNSDVIDLANLGKSTDHNINVLPNTVTINYMNGNHKISSDTATFDGNRKDNSITADYDLPAGYQLAQTNNQLKFNKSANVDISVKPIIETDTINYMYDGTKVGSAQVSGEDMYANDSTFNANDNVTAGYHAVDTNNNFHYDGQSHNVVVKPNTITVNYKHGNKVVGYDTVAYNPSSKVTVDYDMPAGYQLAQNNNQLTFNQPSNVVNVSVTPATKTDVINYMYNDTKVGSTQASGVDVYANGSVFNANTKVPAGYHAVDKNNGFYYDGQIHDVLVAPNVDTDTVNYQTNGKTLASQQFKGNDEHATQAGDNSFDVTAKNATKMPNGYELVNNNNEFSFDNGSHDVAVQAIPQPSAPFMPSMPASSASSASSSASAPASMAAPTSEKPTKAEPATHYQYTKVVTPLQLHTSKHFTKKNGVLTVKHPTEFKIMKIVHDHKYTRYEVRYNHKNYFITANDHFTINNYVQKHDFKSHKHMVVKVIKPMIEYKHIRYSKKNAVRNIHKGTILSVKKVFTIGKGEKTRFELTNGRFVTSNKLFVKVIK